MAKFNSSTIPRPLNCFLMYRLEKQKEIVAKCAGANHRDISKIIAKWWQEATEEEKKPFRERARIAKQEHNKLYPNYKYTPKKKVTPKRIYIRRNKKDQFTSRAQENNKLMEMIYESPNALESIAKEPAPWKPTTVNETRKNSPKVIKKLDSYSNVKAEEFPCNRPTCQYEVPIENYHHYPYQVPNQMSPASTFSETSLVSPYTDCYSEYDMASPSIETSLFEAGYFQFTETTSVLPFNVLNVPFISDFNAYGCQEAGLVDNLYPLNPIANNNIKSTYELDWESATNDVSLPIVQQIAPQHQLNTTYMMQFDQPIQYIDPALLHM